MNTETPRSLVPPRPPSDSPSSDPTRPPFQRPQPKNPTRPSETEPPGWWRIEDMSGSREKVIAAVESNAKIPDSAKTSVLAQINLVPESFNFIYVDAHHYCSEQDLTHNSTCHISVQGIQSLV